MRLRLGTSRNRGSLLRRGGAVLVLAAAAATIGSAQAGTSTKFYSASINPPTVAAGTANAEFTLKLTNEPTSTQTLGSANFTPPANWIVSSPAAGTSVAADDNPDWTINNASNVIQFRANSSGAALVPGASVSATVTTDVPCSASGSATWTTKAKQSNSFSGPPGNDFQPVGNPPTVSVTQGDGDLASFVFDTIGDQAKTVQFTVTITAKDTCGNTKSDYSGGATLGGNLTNLTGTPSYGAITWGSNGVGTASVTASDSQSGAKLTVTDGSVSSDSNTFSVFDAICTTNEPCHADNPGMNVDTTVDSNANAKLTMMLGSLHESFDCGGSHATIGSLVTLNPTSYDNAWFVTLRYSKAEAPGTGVANFVVCLGKNGVFTQLNPCKNAAKPNCIYSRNRNGVGELVIVLLLKPNDPVGGTY